MTKMALTEREIAALYSLPFSARSLVSMRCHVALNQSEKLEIIRAAITKTDGCTNIGPQQ